MIKKVRIFIIYARKFLSNILDVFLSLLLGLFTFTAIVFSSVLPILFMYFLLKGCTFQAIASVLGLYVFSVSNFTFRDVKARRH